MRFPRASGVLLHPTSLPGPHGIGRLRRRRLSLRRLARGAAARRLWQILPLGGIGPGNSPYMSSSAFAGNVLLIDLAELQQQGWLDAADLAPVAGAGRAACELRRRGARSAWSGWRGPRRASPPARTPPQREATSPSFWHAQRSWLDDYALFMALVRSTTTGATGATGTRRWPRASRGAGRGARRSTPNASHFWQFCQWRFFRQWPALKAYANEQGRADHRRRADLHRLPERRGLGAPGAVRTGRRRPAHRGGRRAAGLLQRHRPALGQPAVPLERARQGRLRLVGGARAPHLRAGGHRAHRPLPRLCRLLGDPGQRAHGRARAAGCRAPASRCSRPSPRRWGRCPSSPRTWA